MFVAFAYPVAGGNFVTSGVGLLRNACCGGNDGPGCTGILEVPSHSRDVGGDGLRVEASRGFACCERV